MAENKEGNINGRESKHLTNEQKLEEIEALNSMVNVHLAGIDNYRSHLSCLLK